MIIFVHREEYYNPDTDRKGIGEIILSVARSVEPGTFYTLFQGQYNRFVELAKGYQMPEKEVPAAKTRGQRITF
jgi:replicative DNA helicase